LGQLPAYGNRVSEDSNQPKLQQNEAFQRYGIDAFLVRFIEGTNHEFWPEVLTFRNERIFSTDRIHGGRQLKDIYLLGLATTHKAQLVTFDEALPLTAVKKSTAKNLVIV